MMLLPSRSFMDLPLISLITVAILLPCHGQMYEGNSCNVNNSPGICTLLRKCIPVYNQLLAGKPPGKICGFSRFDPIICCPEEGGGGKPTPSPTVTPATPEPGPQIDNRKGAISRAKCVEYGQSVYVLKIPPTLSGNRKAVNISQCAIKTRKLIVGGKKADPQEFPHMAAIGYNTDDGIRWLCGGSLISERFVLTAAHCTFASSWGNAAWVRLGDLNLVRDDDNAKPKNVRIIERINSPRYKRPSEYHDIALLKLESDVEFNAWIRPACLPYSESDAQPGDKVLATGWGRVDWADDEGSDDLLKVTLKIIAQPTCNTTFIGGQADHRIKMGIVDEWQLCAGEPGKDTCQGDSGGPLAIFNNDVNCMYTIVGITSLGRLCGSIAPGVYTRVSHHLPWIESIVWPNA